MEQTLTAAHALFAERGFTAVTMDDVAAAVGVTKPLLYNYFGNKERLYLACLEQSANALVSTVVDAVAAADRPADALGDGIRAFFGFVEQDRSSWAVLFDETLPANGEIADQVAQYREQILDAVASASLQQFPPDRREQVRVETEALSTAILGAVESPHPLVAADRGDPRQLRRRTPHRDHPAWPPAGLRTPRHHIRRTQPMTPTVRRVAVVGGNRIPFARSNGPYAHASNSDMLAAALDGLIERYNLQGETLGEVVAGAVLKHPRDRDLTREVVLGSKLAPETPAYDVQQACGTGLETAIAVANKIALGQIDAGIAGGVDTTSDAPLALNDDLREVLLDANRIPDTAGRLKLLTRLRPGMIKPSIPANQEPRTGLSMGEHCAIMASEWGITREAQDELTIRSHNALAAAYDKGFQDDLITPYLGLERDQNLRPGSHAGEARRSSSRSSAGPRAR